jgi:osmotically-inducible protein OsmY
MGKLSKKRGDRALDAAVGAFEQARATLLQRLDDIDLDDIRKRGLRLAGSVQSDLERRIRPRRRLVTPWRVAGIAGLVLLGGAAAGAGFVIYDRGRREAAGRRLGGVRARARERYAELTGGRTQAEADLLARVNHAIAAAGAPPEGLEVAVEGGTVYLRGAVADPAFVDAAAERAHGVRGVVAVVNLSTSAAREQATPRT